MPSTSLHEPHSSSQSIAIRKAVLTILGLAMIYALFQLPVYNWWLETRLIRYYNELPQQWRMKNPEKVLFSRHGYAYLIPRQIDQTLPKTAVVLLPSRQYVRKHFSKRMFRWYHGAWNYYFFGPERKYYHYDPNLKLPLDRITHVVLPLTDSTLVDPPLLANSMLVMPPIPSDLGMTVQIRSIPVASPRQLQGLIRMIEINSE